MAAYAVNTNQTTSFVPFDDALTVGGGSYDPFSSPVDKSSNDPWKDFGSNAPSSSNTAAAAAIFANHATNHQPQPQAQPQPQPQQPHSSPINDPAAQVRPPKLEVDPAYQKFTKATIPDKLETPPRAKAVPHVDTKPKQSNQPLPQGSPPSAKKRCVISGCENERFGRAYCAMHLSDMTAISSVKPGTEPPTPTTRIRNINKLWHKDITSDKKTGAFTITWTIVHQDDEHTIFFLDNTFLGKRMVTINNKQIYNEEPPAGNWQIEATIGKSFRTALNLKLIAKASLDGYSYELFVDDVPFEEAHANFLSKLSERSLMQRFEKASHMNQKVVAAQQRQADSPNRLFPSGFSNPSPSPTDAAAVQKLQAQQLKDSLYVSENWHMLTDDQKTHLGYAKSRVTWHFTVHGHKHLLMLEYSHVSGKKKLTYDGSVILEKKPSLFSTNRHKPFTHQFEIEDIPCSVSIARNKQSKEDMELDPSYKKDQVWRPFTFELEVDGVPFAQCCQTETDLAGGSIALDQLKIQREASSSTAVDHKQAHQRGASGTSVFSPATSSTSLASDYSYTSASAAGGMIQQARRNSLHVALTSAEYEAQLEEENARERAEEAALRRKKRHSQGSSSSSSDEEDVDPNQRL